MGNATITVKTRRVLGIPSNAAAQTLENLQVVPEGTSPSLKSEVQQSDGAYSGKVTVNGENITVGYIEPDAMRVEYTFPKKDWDILMLSRCPLFGDSLFLVFEKGKRRVCVNYGADGPFEIITHAQVLENSYFTDGRIRMEYSIELHGLRVEKTELEICVRKCDD